MSETQTKPSQTKLSNGLQTFRGWVQLLAAWVSLLVPLYFAVAALGSRFGLWSWQFGFGVLTRDIGMKLLLVLLVVAIISLILALFLKPRKGLFISVIALAIPLAGMGHAASVVKKAKALPFIHDITTDTQDVPEFSETLIALREAQGGTNALTYIGKKVGDTETLVSVAQVKAYPDIRPLIREENPAVLFDKALAATKAMGWKVVSEDKSAGRIEATDTTFWFGFKDDVVIRIRAAEAGGSVLDMRSISRVGGSDLGANAERIRRFALRL